MANPNTHSLVLLDTPAAARVLGKSPRTLEDWRHKRIGPAHVRVGPVVMYEKEVLTDWLARKIKFSDEKEAA